MRTITISPGSEFTDSDNPTRTKKDAKDLFPKDEQIQLVIEEGITEIGWGSFAGCDNLVSVEIPPNVTRSGWTRSSVKNNRMKSNGSTSSYVRQFIVKSEDKVCPNCHLPVAKGIRFCENWGQKL